MASFEAFQQIAALSAAYHGVFGAEQWLSVGLTRRQLRTALQHRSVEQLGTRSYRFAGHPSSWLQQAAAGLLDLGPGACVAGDVGARLLGLDGFGEATEPSFFGPRALRNLQTVGKVRSSAVLQPIDRVMVDRLQVLSASRLIIEECDRWSQTQLASAIDSACRLGWSSPEFLGRQLTRLRGSGKPGVRHVDRLLDEQRTESWLERAMLRLIRDHRLPDPTTQHRIALTSGSIARVDMLWETARIVVELSGHRFHSTRSQVARDQQRHTELTLLGYRVLTFTYDDVTTRPEWVVSCLRRAFQLAA